MSQDCHTDSYTELAMLQGCQAIPAGNLARMPKAHKYLIGNLASLPSKKLARLPNLHLGIGGNLEGLRQSK